MQQLFWNGDEFSPGEKVNYHWGERLEQISEVTIISWSKEYGGFWYIKLENGSPHYTRFISKL